MTSEHADHPLARELWLGFLKTVGAPMARNIVLKELGLPGRHVPAAEAMLARNQLPDCEPPTHLKPLR